MMIYDMNYVNMNVYSEAMDGVPIVNVGRVCIIVLFTLRFLRRRPMLFLAVTRYWLGRVRRMGVI